MNRNLLYPAAGVLALAVSPLFAQQDDAPETPQPETPQVEEESVDAPAVAEAPVVAEESEDEPADVIEVEVEAIPLQPARQGVVVQRGVVVRGNGLVIGGPGGVQPRLFDEAIAGLPELPLGAVTDGITTDADPSSYRFDTEGPGLLTVAVRAKEGDDMTIEVYGPSGQELARCDIDFGGETGAEHLAVPIPEQGSYRVVVQPLSNGGPFWMGASWLDFEELEAVAPVGPEDAIELTPGQPQDAALEGIETWFTYTAPASGLLMFSTSADGGDLVLEAYYDGHFDQAVQSSDQDRNGNGANERILIDLTEGQTVYFKARSFGAGQDIEFNVRSRFIDDDE